MKFASENVFLVQMFGGYQYFCYLCILNLIIIHHTAYSILVMKKSAIISLSLLAAFGAFAQAKLDVGAIEKLSAAKMLTAPAARSGEMSVIESTRFERAPFFVTVDDESDILELEKMGYTVVSHIDDMAIVSMTPSQLMEIVELPFVQRISASEEVYTLLNDARAATGVDIIHSGPSKDASLPSSFTGKNVVVGIMDTGVDINHINFLKDVSSTGFFTGNPAKDLPNRASRVWILSGQDQGQTFDTPEKIAAFQTDKESATHGTHVLGIAAGSFKGKCNAPTITASGGTNSISKANPFYGVAYDADLAVACGDLTTANISSALSRVSQYAKEVGKPAVMNLSLGHTAGPHDGTSDYSEFLDKAGKDMIICVSAGNEADLPIAIENFTGGSLKTCLATSGSVGGHWEIWNGNSDALSLTFIVMDKETNSPAWTYRLKLTPGETYYLTGTYYNNPAYDTQAKMDDYFSNQSNMIVTCGVNSKNNRYSISIQGNFQGSGNKSRRYIPAIQVDGKAGQKMSVYGNNSTALYSNGFAGFSQGSGDGSINEMACAKNVIAVGAYVNKTQWALNGNQKGKVGFNGVSKGQIAPFSSYGKTFDGRQLPHVAGPGMGMISSMSYYYYQNLQPGNEDYDGMVFGVDEGTKRKRSSYWVQMSGTSMSSPFVAGVMALWLEADPTLTVEEARNIINETADQDTYTRQAPARFGAGKINALAGLKKVLAISSGINDVAADGRDILINQTGDNTYDLFCAGADRIQASLYSVSGMLVATATATGDNLVFTPEASNGIYILKVEAGNRTATQKVTLR